MKPDTSLSHGSKFRDYIVMMVLASSLSKEISANEDSRSSLILFLKAVFIRPSAENDHDHCQIANMESRIALFALDRQ